MLSGEVLATVVSSRNMVFLSLGTEMLFLLVIFQLLREAGLAVPGALGHSIGIIGGLVLGQAAVAANIVSKVVLIIVALSGLGNFAIPDYSTQMAVAYYRVFLLMMAWIGGLLGMSCALILTVAYLVSLKSYGVPFLTPAAPKANAWGPWLLRGRVRGSKRPPDEMNTRRTI
jgi:spore germination protein KA